MSIQDVILDTILQNLSKQPMATKLGIIPATYVKGDPIPVIFDGEIAASEKTFPAIAGFYPRALDRVVLVQCGSTWLIAGRVTIAPEPAIPVGVITMWSGAVDAIPTDWTLCNGENGTPDLRGRFIVGAGDDYNVGNTGGESTHTLAEAEMPAHNHTASSNSVANHAHTVSVAEDGEHLHTINIFKYDIAAGESEFGYTPFMLETGITQPTAEAGAHNHATTVSQAGGHGHTITVNNTGSGQAHENRPPYYALCYIMYVG